MGMMDGIWGTKANYTAVFVIACPIQEFTQMDQTHHSNIPLFRSERPNQQSFSISNVWFCYG
jgi:hypothetical protein